MHVLTIIRPPLPKVKDVPWAVKDMAEGFVLLECGVEQRLSFTVFYLEMLIYFLFVRMDVWKRYLLNQTK